MENEQTNTTDTTGKEANKPVETTEKDISELDKLKTNNDDFEKELVRGRELKAESQKLEAEKQMAGTAGGGIEHKIKTQDDKDEEAAKLFMQEDE